MFTGNSLLERRQPACRTGSREAKVGTTHTAVNTFHSVTNNNPETLGILDVPAYLPASEVLLGELPGASFPRTGSTTGRVSRRKGADVEKQRAPAGSSRQGPVRPAPVTSPLVAAPRR